MLQKITRMKNVVAQNQTRREMFAIFLRVLLEKTKEEEVLQHGSCCRKLQKMRFRNKGLVAGNQRRPDLATRALLQEMFLLRNRAGRRSVEGRGQECYCFCNRAVVAGNNQWAAGSKSANVSATEQLLRKITSTCGARAVDRAVIRSGIQRPSMRWMKSENRPNKYSIYSQKIRQFFFLLIIW